MEKILKFSSVLVTIVLMAMFTYVVSVCIPGKEKEEQKKRVSFALNDVNKIDVSLYDAKNKLLHSERVNPFNPINPKVKTVKTYNLNPLSDGIYCLETESNTKIEKYEIVVVGETATIMSDPFFEEYKTVAVK